MTLQAESLAEARLLEGKFDHHDDRDEKKPCEQVAYGRPVTVRVTKKQAQGLRGFRQFRSDGRRRLLNIET